jgi:DNA invertase Pin-like site-specific DNA recombinase
MVIGYIRVSTEQRDVRNQHHEILEYANQHKLRKIVYNISAKL